MTFEEVRQNTLHLNLFAFTTNNFFTIYIYMYNTTCSDDALVEAINQFDKTVRFL